MARVVAAYSGAPAGQYVGTAKAAPPGGMLGSSSCRSLNGAGDRILLAGVPATFTLAFTFWRSSAAVAPDDYAAYRLFTQHCVGGTRVGVGVNRSNLALIYTGTNGVTSLLETHVQLLDTQRHLLVLEVSATAVTVFLDGRVAATVATNLAPPTASPSCIGSDASRRFFKGYVDDVALYTPPLKDTANWARYYLGLVSGAAGRDYIPAQFVAYVGAAVEPGGFAASGASSANRAALSAPLSDILELSVQAAEFRFVSATSRVGVFNTTHDLATQELGSTSGSFAFLSEGGIEHAGVLSSAPGWAEGDIAQLVWKPTPRELSLWVNGTHRATVQVPAGTWTVATSFAPGTVFLNSGQAFPFKGPLAPGVAVKTWSKLSTDFRRAKLGDVRAILDDSGSELRDAYTAEVIGEYFASEPLGENVTDSLLDVGRHVGGGIQVFAGPHTVADHDFFFAVAFSPDAADLAGDVVLLEAPGKWGIKLVAGFLRAWVGNVEVTSFNPPFTAGGRYLVGVTRSGLGKLVVWTPTKEVALQSDGEIEAQTAADVWVGSDPQGDLKFAGRVSHLLLSSTPIPPWKMERLKSSSTWDTPQFDPAIPANPSVVKFFEMSWRDVVKAGVATLPIAEDCFIGGVAIAPDKIGTGFKVEDRVPPAGFTSGASKPWAKASSLAEACGPDATSVKLTYFAAFNPGTGTAVLLGDEICEVGGFNPTTGILTITRGCVDTLPVSHPAGEVVWAYEDKTSYTGVAYPQGSVVDARIISTTAVTQAEPDTAPTATLTLQGRLKRPYPPGNVAFAEVRHPVSLAETVEITWDHRNKLLHLGNLIGFYDEVTVTAPIGLTYHVIARDAVSKAVLLDSGALPRTSTSYPLFVDGFVGRLEVELYCEDDGIRCAQSIVREFSYTYSPTVLPPIGGELNLPVLIPAGPVAAPPAFNLPDEV